MTNNPQARGWCFTLNNPVDITCPGQWKGDYVVWQLETAPTTGTPHLQGYIYFRARKRLGGLKALNKRVHWLPAKGTALQNKAYCSKEEGRISGPYEQGELPQQGKRSDILALKETIDSGASIGVIRSRHYSLWIRHQKAVQNDRLYVQRRKANRGRPEILVVYGPSGTGKTKTVREAFPKAYWLDKPSRHSSVWFDGYEGESTIVVDEFFGWISYHFLKRLLDYGYTKGQTKGGHVAIAANRFIFTSNQHPRLWYKKDIEGALRRRIDEFGELLFVDGDGKWSWEQYLQPDPPRKFQSHLGGVRFVPY